MKVYRCIVAAAKMQVELNFLKAATTSKVFLAFLLGWQGSID